MSNNCDSSPLTDAKSLLKPSLFASELLYNGFFNALNKMKYATSEHALNTRNTGLIENRMMHINTTRTTLSPIVRKLFTTNDDTAFESAYTLCVV